MRIKYDLDNVNTAPFISDCQLPSREATLLLYPLVSLFFALLTPIIGFQSSPFLYVL